MLSTGISYDPQYYIKSKTRAFNLCSRNGICYIDIEYNIVKVWRKMSKMSFVYLNGIVFIIVWHSVVEDSNTRTTTSRYQAIRLILLDNISIEVGLKGIFSLLQLWSGITSGCFSVYFFLVGNLFIIKIIL